MEEKRVGRKTIYTDDDLKTIIKQYCMEHIGQKVTITKLVSYSNVSRATWYRSKAAQEYINNMNYAPLLVNVKDTSIPTMNEIKKICGVDIDKYKEMVGQLLDIIASQDEEINRLKMVGVKTDSDKVAHLKEELLEKEKIIKRLNEKINIIIGHA